MAYSLITQMTAHEASGVVGNTKVASFFGLPGQNQPAAFCRTEFDVYIVVSNNMRVYVNIGGNNAVYQTNILASDYPSVLAVQPYSFSAQPGVSGVVKSWTTIVGSNRIYAQSFNVPVWPLPNPPAGVVNDAQLDAYMSSYDFVFVDWLQNLGYNPATASDAYIYIGGTGVYSVTNPIWPISQQVIIPRIRTALDYFPGAVYVGGSFQSCNRLGGFFRRRNADGSWTDIRNSEAISDPNNPGNIRKSNAWVRMELMQSGEVIPMLTFDKSSIDLSSLPPSRDSVTLTATNNTSADAGNTSFTIYDDNGIFSIDGQMIAWAQLPPGGSVQFPIAADPANVLSGVDVYQAELRVVMSNHPAYHSIPLTYTRLKSTGATINLPPMIVGESPPAVSVSKVATASNGQTAEFAVIPGTNADPATAILWTAQAVNSDPATMLVTDTYGNSIAYAAYTVVSRYAANDDYYAGPTIQQNITV